MSKIQWTEETWNPVVGCSKISAGCEHCYAEGMAKRLAYMDTPQYAAVVHEQAPGRFGGWNGQTVLVESALQVPMRWKKPKMIFVCSMGDLFHESVPDEWIDEVFSMMAGCPQHTFQVLTKRAERLPRYFADAERRCIERLGDGCGGLRVLPNVWIGVTVENQEQADARIPFLLSTPAAIHFVSVEPMLGPVDLGQALGIRRWAKVNCSHYAGGCSRPENPAACTDHPESKPESCTPEYCVFGHRGLDWVICGCESGPGRRPMDLAWAEVLEEQCRVAQVPFFMKQLQTAPSKGLKVVKELDQFPEWLRVRAFPGGD